MRRIRGVITMPLDAPSTTALVRVQLRDVTYADAESVVVAQLLHPGAVILPGGRYPFELEAPESARTTSLSLRCHIDLAGTGAMTKGDLVSTQSVPVAPIGDVGPLTVPVELV